MKIEVNVTKVTLPANEVLGSKEKVLYYLVIGEGENKTTINVGEKTHDAVSKLTQKQK